MVTATATHPLSPPASKPTGTGQAALVMEALRTHRARPRALKRSELEVLLDTTHRDGAGTSAARQEVQGANEGGISLSSTDTTAPVSPDLDSVFKKFDTNNDGVLDIGEATKATQAQGWQGGEKAVQKVRSKWPWPCPIRP